MNDRTTGSERRRRAAAAMAAMALIALGCDARAQGLGSGGASVDRAGYEQGAQEGRIDGRIEGMRGGRDQVVIRAFVRAFRAALEATPEDAAERYLAIARERAAADATSAGRAAGRDAGRRAALADESAPVVPESPVPPGLPRDLDACRPPRPIEMELPSGATTILRLDLMPDDGVGLGYELPEPDIDSQTILRARARREAGLTGRDVGTWVEWYVRGFEDAFRETYHEQREKVSEVQRQPFARQGAVAGQLEGARRIACKVLADAWDAAWTQTWRAAYREGVESAVEDVRTGRTQGPLVELDGARLVGDDEDGVLEPGETAWLVATVENHGTAAGDGPPRVGSLRAVRGLAPLAAPAAAEGDSSSDDTAPRALGHDVAVPPALTSVPAPGEPTSLRVAVGRVLPDAPPGSSVVVLVEPPFGRRSPVTAKVERPARLAEATGTLLAEEGRLVVAVTATVVSVARAGTTDELVVTPVTDETVGRSATRTARDDASTTRIAGDASATAAAGARTPPLEAGGQHVARLSAPLPADALAGDAAPVFAVALRDGDGATWDTHPVAIDVGIEALVSVLPLVENADPIARRLWTALLADVEHARDDPDLLDASSALGRYAAAIRALPADQRSVVDQRIGRPLAEHVERNASRALRKSVRAFLDG